MYVPGSYTLSTHTYQEDIQGPEGKAELDASKGPKSWMIQPMSEVVDPELEARRKEVQGKDTVHARSPSQSYSDRKRTRQI